ncbi:MULTISPECIES: TRAP transporter large permease [Marinobacter]|jgi:C4-dicarboxylate transporter, DctM subunit|uniref:TRAP transporter large permease protein n=4 Tax=Marinobacter nauticus TaxID=2743 RepID=A0A350RUM6_MARNT|nr:MULTISPECIES: TRAP transporter large permease [Marinobacter]MCG8521481.1 TRAP transporter large permease [Pseudomonadales bacterium]MEC8822531.1 TRAP transporter large permease [Pseudomonadota bacterium]ABM17457.1 TRAP dicarboxylate transporter, DctM subunit [Marinobacter nauticus VT8]ERS11596.1 C4-dicarboxylate ABC transporter permease [Marinobacter sp. EN3]ERS82147.1 C4-dicarboxylate ABC transporter permease [Marinobacter sp. C1S70]|tara:strand:+ start:962 stop:2248 length:1287 start_codon:yes stop_codon:yes gene_type:complete
MATIMMIVMIGLLLLGFPMMIPLTTAAVIGFVMMFDGFGQMGTFIQQMMGGIRPASLIAVPMFILAADIMTRGQSADRLINMVMAFIGHIKGGLAISTATSCTLFGAVSGSTQATVVAVGSPLRPKMLKAGYSDPFTLALIINASDIAFLIPPSIGMIIYGVISETSIAELFIAGIGPGILILFMFSIYCLIYAYKNDVPTEAKASWKERAMSVRDASWPLMFPVIIVGGIYGGIFSPTEAAAVCVLYAFLLEFVVFRSLKLNDIYKIAKSTGLITAVVFILVAVGNGFSWIISFAQIPQAILEAVGVNEAGPVGVLIAICVAFFIACMFVDPIVVILVLTPIFAPAIQATGLDPVLVGVLITLQVAIGSATPPFGCDIFTAIAIFKRPYMEVIRGTPPFIFMLVAAAGLIIAFPDIALFLRDIAFRD